MSASLVSYDEEDGYYDELDESFQKIRLAHEHIHQATQKAHRASTDANGVPSFHNVVQRSSSKVVDWETLGACYDYVGIDQGGSDLDKLLKSIPNHKHASGFGLQDNETISTCSASEESISTFSSKGTVFISSSDRSNSQGDKKTSGSKSVKTKLRAIASIIDPKFGQKIQNRRGFWSGVFEDNTQEGAVEVVCVP